MILVALTAGERRVAKLIGAARGRDNDAWHSNPGHDGPLDDELKDDLGCCGELAVAKALDRYWSGALIEDLSWPDVGPYEVRSTIHPTGRLLLRPGDDPDRCYILVRSLRPDHSVMGIVGWAWGRQVLATDVRDAERHPHHLLDNHLLHSMAALPVDECFDPGCQSVVALVHHLMTGVLPWKSGTTSRRSSAGMTKTSST